MKKLKMLIALMVMSFMVIVPMTGCSTTLVATMYMEDKTVMNYYGAGSEEFAYLSSLGYTEDAVKFNYYSDNTMKIYNVSTDNADFSEVIPAGIADFEQDTALSRRGNDIMQKAEKVVIEKNVTGIGSHYFYQCSALKEVHIGPDVSYIGKNAFKDCVSLTKITIDPANTNFEIKYGCLIEVATGLVIRALDDENIVLGDDINQLSESAFYGCKNLKSVDMSNTNIRVIPEKAFRECSNLVEVKFSSVIEEIGHSSFFMCGNLKNIDFSGIDTLKTIGEYAFYRCNSIQTVKFPENLSQIKAMAFAKCDGITTVVTGENSPTIGYCAFYECDNIKEVYVNSEKILADAANSSRNGYLISINYYGSQGFVERDITLFVNKNIDESAFGAYFDETPVYNDRNELVRVVPEPYNKGGEVTVDGITYVQYDKNVTE